MNRTTEDHKVHRSLDPANTNPAQLAAIDLALHTRHALDNRLVVALLAQDHHLLELAVAACRAVRNLQLRVFLVELVQHLHCTEVGKLPRQGDDVIPVCIEPLVPPTLPLLCLNDGLVMHRCFLTVLRDMPS